MTRALGFDLSQGDGKVDFVKAKSAGITFMYTKATQKVVDSVYYRNMDGAKAVGMLRGAFHYLDLGIDITQQANLFINTIKNDIGELPPVIDFEQDPNGIVYPGQSKAIRQGKVWTFVDTVQKALGVKCGIYVGFYYWNDFGDPGTNWSLYPLWEANWNPENLVKIPLPWKVWKFWQYTGSAHGPDYGVEALSLDLDYYNGTIDDLIAWAKPAPIPLTWTQSIDAWARKQPNPYTGPGPT